MTLTISELKELLPGRYHSTFRDFELAGKLSISEVADLGVHYLIACLPKLGSRFNSNLRLFAYDCLQILRPGYRKRPYADVIEYAFETNDKLIQIFDMASDTIFWHACGDASDSDLQRVLQMIDVPKESHRHFNKMMALGYALQPDIPRSIERLCFYVEADAPEEHWRSRYYEMMNLALRKRF